MDLPSYLSESTRGILLDVFVQPRASKDAIVGTHGSALKLKVKAPPDGGRANEAVENLVSAVLRNAGLRVRAEVVAGFASRSKRVEISGATVEQIASAIR